MHESLDITWNGFSFALLPQRALHWPAQRTLIIADAHFGKAAAFRHHGVPVPDGTTQADLDRLSRLLDATRSRRLIILGDFFHARAGCDDPTMQAITQWRIEHSRLDVILVRGNHDLNAGDPPPDWNFQCVAEPFDLDGVTLVHNPDHSSLQSLDRPALAGHVHPCAVLRDSHGSGLRSTCFHFRAMIAVLPAFGSFTGAHPISPRRGERVFAIGPDCVLEVKAPSAVAAIR